MTWASIFNQLSTQCTNEWGQQLHLKYYIYTFSETTLVLKGVSGICQSWVLSNWSCLVCFKRTKHRSHSESYQTLLPSSGPHEPVHSQVKPGSVNANRLLSAPKTRIPLKEQRSNIEDKQTLKIIMSRCWLTYGPDGRLAFFLLVISSYWKPIGPNVWGPRCKKRPLNRQIGNRKLK